MSFSSGLNPDVVKTLLDDVFNQAYSGDLHPGHVNAESPSIFKQDSTNLAAVTMAETKGVGAWETRAEEQDVPSSDPRIANNKTFTISNYAKSIDISKNFFDDNQHSSYENMVSNFARRARTTRDRNAFAVFRNGFTSATTADGAALFSDSHTTIEGQTVDNKLTAALSETSLNTAIIQMLEMKSQDGEIDGFMPRVLLVPPKLFKTACEITKSEFRSGTANNDINVYSTQYSLTVATSQFLGAAAGGSDTAWYLLSDDHSVMRFVRQAVQTALVDWIYQRNNNYIYKGEFRETVGALSWGGIIGSDGTT